MSPIRVICPQCGHKNLRMSVVGENFPCEKCGFSNHQENYSVKTDEEILEEAHKSIPENIIVSEKEEEKS